MFNKSLVWEVVTKLKNKNKMMKMTMKMTLKHRLKQWLHNKKQSRRHMPKLLNKLNKPKLKRRQELKKRE